MTKKDILELLRLLDEGLGEAQPALNRLLTRLEETAFSDAAFALRANFYNERSVRNAQECETRIKLMADAMDAGLTEDAALRVLHTVYGKEPPIKEGGNTTDVIFDKVSPLLEALIAGLSRPKNYPFPSTMPNLNEVMTAAGWAGSGGAK